MLVLTRKLEDQIQIGPNITITVLRVRGRSVQIGVDAPENVRVLRGEVAARIELLSEPNDSLAEGPERSNAPRPTHRANTPPRRPQASASKQTSADQARRGSGDDRKIAGPSKRGRMKTA